MHFNVSWVFRCLRWSYFKYKYPELEIFDKEKVKAGLRTEKLVYRYLKSMHPKRGKNRRIYFEKFVLTGRPDFTVKGSVIEVKKSRLEAIRPEWKAQLNLYLLLENALTGFIFEVGQRIRITKIGFSSELLRESISYFLELEKFISEGKIPPAVKKWYCRHCSFRNLCNNRKIYSHMSNLHFHEHRRTLE